MQICNYCGRNLRKKYDYCPGCNSNSFTFKPGPNDQYVITTPPQDGYHLNYELYREFFGETNWIAVTGGIIGFFSLMSITFLITGASISIVLDILTVLIGTPIAITLCAIGFAKTNKARNELARKERLSKTGMLVKNIPYQLIQINSPVTHGIAEIAQVIYDAPNGQRLSYTSDPRLNIRTYDFDGKVDLLIDPTDYSNYYIDVEII